MLELIIKKLKYREMKFVELPNWYKEIIDMLMNTEFPGKAEIKKQLHSADYILDERDGSLKVKHSIAIHAPVEKTIPVEAYANDLDGILIQVLLFTREGITYLLEILREDGNSLIVLPPASSFKVMVLPK